MADGNSDENYDDDIWYGSDSYEEDDEVVGYESELYGDNDDDDVKYQSDSCGVKGCYSILSEEDIHERQQADIAETASLLTLSSGAATSLLRCYNWDVVKVQDVWFGDEKGVREKVGLFEEPIVVDVDPTSTKELVSCRVCFDTHPKSMFMSVSCGHLFCSTCWKSYISISIIDGPGCLMLRCPSPSCNAIVDQDMVDKTLVGDDDLKTKYSRYLVRSYIESGKKAKWCPAPGCEYAIEHEMIGDDFGVTCNCAHYFCWNCSEEAHRPVDCGTVEKWMIKNSSEAENTNWILANSKPCPKCKRPIEKNSGCMHMTCSEPCKFHFCWLCLGPWSEHSEATGGYYACNRYEADKKEQGYDEVEERRGRAKAALDKYTHYYERWMVNHSSRERAIKSLQQMKDVGITKLSERYYKSHSQLSYIKDAWSQIVECRRILKWTYVYGYYLPEEEQEKKRFFEYLQGEAEHGLERLHCCAEIEVGYFLNEDMEDRESQPQPTAADSCPEKGDEEAFTELQGKLSRLTKVTNTFFENLMRALENGLVDVGNTQRLLQD